MNYKKILACTLACLTVATAFSACSSIGEVEVPSSQADDTSSQSTTDADTQEESTDDFVPLFESDYYTDDGLFKDLVAADYMEIGDYLSLEIPEDILTVTDEVLDLEVENLLSSYTEVKEREDAEYLIQDGDTVNIDYVGSVDGVEFDGGSTQGAGTEVTIGVTSYIDGFLEQLVGHKKGENFDIDVTFPTDYGNTDLAGKDAVFNITINTVYENIVPEFTDEFISGISNGEYETTQQYLDAIKTSNYRVQRDSYVNVQILELATFNELPENLMTYLEDATRSQITSTALSYGVTEEDIVSQYGFTTVDELIASEKENLEANAKNIMIVQYIAQENDLKMTTEDINEYFGVLDWSSYETQYGENYLKNIAMNNAVYEFIVTN